MLFSAVVVYFGMPETYNMSLEGVAVQFEDKVVGGKIEDIITSGKIREAEEEHVEGV
jgi:hypothetical protein